MSTATYPSPAAAPATRDGVAPLRQTTTAHLPVAPPDDPFEETLYLGARGRRVHRDDESKADGLFDIVARLPPLRWYAAHVAPRRLRCERIDVPLDGLPTGLDGLRIGFLSDTHHAPGRPLTMLARGITLLHAASPDLILHGGDYVVDDLADFAPCAALLGQLRAPLGVYGVYGNHDYRAHRASTSELAAQLAPTGLRLLRNESVRLSTPGGAPFWLVGLDDALRGHPDLATAVAGVPGDEFRLLLAHEPDIADHLGGRRIDLQLSGHSHGGQVVLPGFGPPLLPALGRRYVRGLCHAPTHPVYTSRGLGTVPPFVRFNCPPEVTVLTLRAVC